METDKTSVNRVSRKQKIITMLFTHKYKQLISEQHGDPMSDFILAPVQAQERLMNTPEKNKSKMRQCNNYLQI